MTRVKEVLDVVGLGRERDLLAETCIRGEPAIIGAVGRTVQLGTPAFVGRVVDQVLALKRLPLGGVNSRVELKWNETLVVTTAVAVLVVG